MQFRSTTDPSSRRVGGSAIDGRPSHSELALHVGRSARCLLSALLVSALLAGNARAQSEPWFGDFAVKFPESLLLDRETTQNSPHVGAPTVSAMNPVGSGVARVSSTSPEELTPPVHPAHESNLVLDDEVALPSPPPSVPEKRRYVFTDTRPRAVDCEDWQILPDGILYQSYVAGEKEPRMGTAILHEVDRGPILESIIGGRLGLLRYGTQGPINPQGWQWDLESAAMLRQDFDEELDVEATDFRIGTVLTWRRGATALKGGIYHLSSHVGDEFLERHPTFERRNYSRDALLFGIRQHLTEELQIYGEIAYAIREDGGSEPLELQFGAEFSSIYATDPYGAPFAAINVHLREEFDFGGGVNILAGWEWRGPTSNRRFRVGGQYYTGKEIQWSFFDDNITLLGAGIWYDF